MRKIVLVCVRNYVPVFSIYIPPPPEAILTRLSSDSWAL